MSQMPPTESGTEVGHQSTPYRVPRSTLIWAWWKRLMLQRRTLIALGIWTAMVLACAFLLPGEFRLLAVLPAVFLFLAPLNVYQLYAKSVDSEPQVTDQKTVEFSRSRLAFTGPDWRNEMSWSRFNGLSEDAEYFFLELRHSSLATVIPKEALTAEQQELLREYAPKRST